MKVAEQGVIGKGAVDDWEVSTEKPSARTSSVVVDQSDLFIVKLDRCLHRTKHD